MALPARVVVQHFEALPASVLHAFSVQGGYRCFNVPNVPTLMVPVLTALSICRRYWEVNVHLHDVNCPNVHLHDLCYTDEHLAVTH